MTRLALVVLATSSAMGQQAYEHQIAERSAAVLGPSWQVERLVVRTLRTALPGTVRVPRVLLAGKGARARRLAGRAVYRGRDVVHRMDLRLPPAGDQEILTVHDLAPWRYPDEVRLPRLLLREADRASIIVCPSQFAADEVSGVVRTPEVTVIPNGVDDAFFDAHPLDEAELERLGIRHPFVLHAGGCTERKNLGELALAWRRVRAAHPDASLVMAGPPDPRRHALFGPQLGTVLLGRVPAPTLPGLMAAAAAVVVPSVYEGFGLPAIEAMAAGTVVVAAARGALPEVCGGAAIVVEPTGAGLADGLGAALAAGADVADLVDRGRTRASGFTWSASAELHAEVWRRL